MATLGTEERGRFKEVAAVARFNWRVHVWIFCPPERKNYVAVVRRWPLAEVRLH